MNLLWGLPYFVWLVICLLVATMYLIFTPKEADAANRAVAARLILKYAHATVWLLLALVCLLMNYTMDRMATVVSFAALVIYLIFIFTLIRIKMVKEK